MRINPPYLQCVSGLLLAFKFRKKKSKILRFPYMAGAIVTVRGRCKSGIWLPRNQFHPPDLNGVT
jgi:hypothetical protein